jgi:DNA repair protein RecO (recombination protein O)
MGTFETRSFVLGGVNYGESHRIVDLLSATHGRHAAMVYRARSPKSKFGRFFDLGNCLNLSLQRGKGDLPRVISAGVNSAPQVGRDSIERLALLTYACEVVGAFTVKDHPAPKMYRLLEALLCSLELPEPPTQATVAALDAKVLTFSGHMPSLRCCVHCGEPVGAACVFSSSAGGVGHQECVDGESFPFAAFSEIEALRRTSLADTIYVTRKLKAPTLLTDFIEYTIGRELKSRAMVQALLLM